MLHLCKRGSLVDRRDLKAGSRGEDTVGGQGRSRGKDNLSVSWAGEDGAGQGSGHQEWETGLEQE